MLAVAAKAFKSTKGPASTNLLMDWQAFSVISRASGSEVDSDRVEHVVDNYTATALYHLGSFVEASHEHGCHHCQGRPLDVLHKDTTCELLHSLGDFLRLHLGLDNGPGELLEILVARALPDVVHSSRGLLLHLLLEVIHEDLQPMNAPLDLQGHAFGIPPGKNRECLACHLLHLRLGLRHQGILQQGQHVAAAPRLALGIHHLCGRSGRLSDVLTACRRKLPSAWAHVGTERSLASH